MFKALSQSLYSEGESIYFKCSDPNAILDDNSGRNFFPLECKGDDVLGFYQNILVPVLEEINGTVDTNQTTDVSNQTSVANQTNIDNNTTEAPIQFETVETFVSINDSFEFPKCRRQCTQFYVGRLDFEAVDDTVEVRAGDIAEFSCKEGYYIDAPEPVYDLIYSTVAQLA